MPADEPGRKSIDVGETAMTGAAATASDAASVGTPLAPPAPPQVDDEGRHRMIREAAYRRYQQRGDAYGSDLDDWLQAEQEVDRALGADKPAAPPSSSERSR